MLYQHVNGYDMAYIAVGSGPPLVCVHGSLGDYRTWSPVLGPLSRKHRVIAVSLRRYFPEHWDGVGGGFTIAQHIADVIAFIEKLGAGKVDLMGHSRGGHIAFHVARQRPGLLHRLILAEPGGELDVSLLPPGTARPPARTHVAAAAEKVAAGDAAAGAAHFVDAIEGAGAWQRVPPGARQAFCDNAHTLLGQINEQRQPFARADAEAISVPALFIGGAATPSSLPLVLRALAAVVPGARTAMIANATHFMFDDDPAAFCAAVLEFLA